MQSNVTLSKWFDKWLEVYKNNAVRIGTKTDYILVFEKHIKTFLGYYDLGEIKTSDVRKLINKIEADGLGYATQSRVKVMLTDMFDKAIMDDLIVKNPAKGIRIIKKRPF